MSGDVVIFGLGEMASLAWYALSHDSPYRVAGFTVNAAYMGPAELHGLPVTAFEDLCRDFPPDRHLLLLPIGWKGMNGLRKRKLEEARGMGYGFASYLSSNTRIWPDTAIGVNAIVQQGSIIEPFARIGDDCCLYQRVMVGHHAVVGGHCYVASDVVIGSGASIGEACVLGLGCTIGEGVRVAPRCFIGAGAVVTADTEENGVYLGNPAVRQSVTADRMRVTQ